MLLLRKFTFKRRYIYLIEEGNIFNVIIVTIEYQNNTTSYPITIEKKQKQQ